MDLFEILTKRTYYSHSSHSRLPAGFLDALEVSHAMQWAPPAIFLTTLFLSDYSTTIAFVGMDFETSSTPGPPQPILQLHQRNRQIPYQALGDPALPRTRSKLEGILLMEDSIKGNTDTSDTEQWIHLARQESMVFSFLLAADAMARGESPFLTWRLFHWPFRSSVNATTKCGRLWKSVGSMGIFYSHLLCLLVTLWLPELRECIISLLLWNKPP